MPLSGAWRLTYSLASYVDSGDWNYCYLYLNGDQLPKTEHYTRSSTEYGRSTSGRVVTLEASAGDTIELRATKMDGSYYRMTFCLEYISKM